MGGFGPGPPAFPLVGAGGCELCVAAVAYLAECAGGAAGVDRKAGAGAVVSVLATKAGNVYNLIRLTVVP